MARFHLKKMSITAAIHKTAKVKVLLKIAMRDNARHDRA